MDTTRSRAARLTPTATGITIHTPADGRTYYAPLATVAPTLRPSKVQHLQNGREVLDWMRPSDLRALAN